MKLVMISQNFGLRNRFKEFCEKNDIQEFFVFANSKTALDFFESNEPDFVFVDFLLSSFDGLELLRIVSEKFDFKTIFVVSKDFKTIIKKAIGYGAFKIVDYDFLFEDVLVKKAACHQPTKHDNLDDCVSKLCIEVGITPYLSGYKFIKEAILLMVANPDFYKNVTKNLYPKIAEKFNSSPSRVERSIRHALNTANASEKIEKLNNFLDIKALEKGERITNSQFILTVADRLLYKMNFGEMFC